MRSQPATCPDCGRTTKARADVSYCYAWIDDYDGAIDCRAYCDGYADAKEKLVDSLRSLAAKADECDDAQLAIVLESVAGQFERGEEVK